jgi:hypothetical protein
MGEHGIDEPAHPFAAVGEEVDQLAGHRHPVKLGGEQLAIERRERSLQMLQPPPEGAGNLDGPMQAAGRIHLGDLDMGPAEIPTGGDLAIHAVLTSPHVRDHPRHRPQGRRGRPCP